MNLKKAKDSSTLELMHASTGFWTEVLSMARRVINVIRSCAFAYLLTIAVLVNSAAAAGLRSGTLELDPSKTLIEFRLPGALHTTHGTFKLERGTIIADPATGKAGGSIVVDARSGDTGIGARDNDMRENVSRGSTVSRDNFRLSALYSRTEEGRSVSSDDARGADAPRGKT